MSHNVPTKERMRGFEEEWKEVEEALRAQVDKKTERDLDQLLPEALSLFATRADAAAFERLVHLIRGLRLDPDRLLPLLSARVYEHGLKHGHTVIEHLLQADNAARPHRRGELQARRAQERERAWQKAFHETGLDGAGLLKLLAMKPGPAFGKVLRGVQLYAKGEGELLDVAEPARRRILERVVKARSILYPLSSILAIITPL